MEFPSSRNGWIEWIALTLGAFACTQMNFLFFLFLVPLQLVYLRRGFNAFLLSGTFVAGMIFLFALVRIRGVDSTALRKGLLLMELSLPMLLLAECVWVNYSTVFGYRTLYRLLTAAAGGAVISVPVILALSKNLEFMDLLGAQFEAVARAFQDGFYQKDSFESSVLAGVLAPERMLEYTKSILLKSYVFFCFLVLAGCLHLSDVFLMRVQKVHTRKLDRFTLPEYCIWPLIVGWAGVLLDTWKGIGTLGYVFWNVALVCLFLYGLQGIAVLRALFGRYRVPPLVRLFIGLMCVLIVMRPGLNLIVFIGIPGLGVSELWIRYRRSQ